MEAAVQQYHVDKQCFEIQKKQFLIENDQLLDQIISQDIVNIVVNSSLDKNTSVNVNSFVANDRIENYVEMCNKYLELEAELIKKHNKVTEHLMARSGTDLKMAKLTSFAAEIELSREPRSHGAHDLGSYKVIGVASMKEKRYRRKEHFILPRGRISTAGYEVKTASFILSTAYKYLCLISKLAMPGDEFWLALAKER
ncbi:hypothetical protein Tco_0201232 [Tanacetum coccineum]